MKRSLSGGIRCTADSPKRRAAFAVLPGMPNSRVSPSVAIGDHEGVEAAPALVAREQLRVAEIEPEPLALDQHLDQRRDVAEADIDALPRDRMDAVRGVADQREPVRRDLRGMVEAERIARPRAERPELPQEPAHPLLRLGQEAALGQLEHPRRFARGSPTRRSPSDGPSASSTSGRIANGPCG